MFEDLGIDPVTFDGVQLSRGRGCDRCKQSGYVGRMAIIEAMTISDQIRKLIIARSSTREMAKLAVNQGMRTLRMVALDRARDGMSPRTSLGHHLGVLKFGGSSTLSLGRPRPRPRVLFWGFEDEDENEVVFKAGKDSVKLHP